MSVTIPEQTHSGNDNRSKVVGTPSSGARQMSGKSNEPDGALIKGPAAEAVRTTAAENKGACVAAATRQIEGEDGVRNGDPKTQLTGLFRSES